MPRPLPLSESPWPRYFREYTADACNVRKFILLTESACLEFDETMSPWPRKELGIQMRKLGSVDC